MNYKIFILTIKRNFNRLSCIIDKLNLYNINYEIFYGIDYKNCSKNILDQYSSNGYGKLCPYPTLACALSHILLWDHISRDTSINFAIILEDDTYLNDKLNLYLDYIANNIDNSIIYLYHDLNIGYKKYRFILSTGAYCIQPSTAKKLVNYYSKYKISFHIDFQNNFVLYNLKILQKVIKDNVAEQINGNISSMGIVHNSHVLNLFYNTYIHRIFTTPVIKFNNQTYDLFHIIIFILIGILILLILCSSFYITIFILSLFIILCLL